MLHVAALLAVTPALAQASPDKSAFTLVNATPRSLMREMSTDRPDATESPHTVDAERFQAELSFIEFARNDDGPRQDAFLYAPTNLKVGLRHDLDVQLVLSPYDRVQAAGGEDVSGFGDTLLRLKLNLWGNDEGATAAAIMPYIKFPTAADELGNDHIEGGLILPFALALPAEFSLGLMAQFDVVRAEDDDGYELDAVHSAVLGRKIIGSLAGFVEYFGVVGTDHDLEYRASFNTGMTLALSADIQLDAGVRIGLTGDVDDYAIFAGVSYRY